MTTQQNCFLPCLKLGLVIISIVFVAAAIAVGIAINASNGPAGPAFAAVAALAVNSVVGVIVSCLVFCGIEALIKIIPWSGYQAGAPRDTA